MSKRYNIWSILNNAWTNHSSATLIPGSRHNPKPLTLQEAKALLDSFVVSRTIDFEIKELPKQYNVWDVEQNQFARVYYAAWDNNKQRPKHLSQEEALIVAQDCSLHHRQFVVKEIPACLL